MIAISDDPVADSVKFARELAIGFDLLADLDGATARKLVGSDRNGDAVPGVVLVDPSGAIVFRQIGEDKADRLDAAALLAVVDRTFGPVAGATAAPGPGFAPDRRWQLRVEVGGGVIDQDGLAATAVLGGAALLPLGRHLLLGPTVHGEVRGAIDLGLAATARWAVLPQIGWLYGSVGGGYTVLDGRGPSARAGLGLQFAFDPGRALHLELSSTWRAADDYFPSLVLLLGLSRLLRTHD